MAAGCSHSGRSFCICNLGRKDCFWPWVPLVMCRTIKVITKYKRSFKSYVIYQVHVQKVKFSLMTNLTKKSLEKYWKSISQFSESDSHLFNWRSATCGHNNIAVPAPTHYSNYCFGFLTFSGVLTLNSSPSPVCFVWSPLNSPLARPTQLSTFAPQRLPQMHNGKIIIIAYKMLMGNGPRPKRQRKCFGQLLALQKKWKLK